MPLAFDKVRGKPTLFYLRRVGTTKVTPSTVTATVGAPAAAGATSLTVAALSAAIPKNTVLIFSRAAGSPATVKVVVTADADASDTTLAVDTLDGASGDGLDASLATSDAATWDGLYTDVSSNSLDFQANEQSTDLNPVTHGSGSGVRVVEPEITSIAPGIPRQGFLPNDSTLLRALLRNFKSPNAYWYGKLVLPDEDGAALATYKGFGKILGVTHQAPSDGMVAFGYTFRPVDDDFDVTFAS